METTIVVFTCDLRLHVNHALHQACGRARQVVPLFMADPAVLSLHSTVAVAGSTLASAGLLLRRLEPAPPL